MRFARIAAGHQAMTIRNHRAFAAGAFFIVVALFFLIVSRNYAPGTSGRMGPGYFPRMLSIFLIGIGLFVMTSAVMTRSRIERLKAWDVGGLLWIAGSVVLFAFLLQPLGFVVSLFVLVIVSSKASPEFTWMGALINAAVLTTMCVAIFVYGLGLQLPLWPALSN